MNNKKLFNRSYTDYIKLRRLISDMRFEECYKELLNDGFDVFNKDSDYFDINFGACCFTIVAHEKNGTIDACIDTKSIEVYDDRGLSTCLGTYTLDECIKLGKVKEG